jgi:S1-C subfamily serine protease
MRYVQAEFSLRKFLVNNSFEKYFFILVVVFVLAGCATAPRKEVVVNYSDTRSVMNEIDQTKKILEKNPVEALARACALKENTKGFDQVESLYSEAGTRAKGDFDLAVSSGRWTDALVIFRSLAALSIAPKDWSEAKLIESRVRAWEGDGNETLAKLDTITPSTPADEAPSSGTVSKMIKGTVTVWVDRGLRIENGVGYADRVIGSGFFIDPRGYFITNYHVIQSEVDPKYEGYSRLYIKLPGDQDTRVPAKVIGWDPVFDLALVKTELTPRMVFQLGTSDQLKVGNRIYAIGSPAGLEQTLTSGIVSAQKRRLLSLGDVLQIDAPINHGNSGGPIVDEAGRVQAVVFAGIESYEGLNFAIPVELLRLILPELYAGGKISHPWLGSYGKTATLPGSPDNAGVSLLYSIPGSPCAIAGIPEGAVIQAVNGQTVTSLEDLQYRIIRERPGTIIRLTGLAGANGAVPEKREWVVMLTERPQVPGQEIFDRDIESRAFLPVFGMKLEQVGKSQKYTVASVVRGSIADESGFSEQDVIEIRNVNVDQKNGAVSVQLYTKKRKSGYLDAFIGLASSLDSPSYF